jgi:hypothetical protein
LVFCVHPWNIHRPYCTCKGCNVRTLCYYSYMDSRIKFFTILIIIVGLAFAATDQVPGGYRESQQTTLARS